jgi:hypothetical protein
MNGKQLKLTLNIYALSASDLAAGIKDTWVCALGDDAPYCEEFHNTLHALSLAERNLKLLILRIEGKRPWQPPVAISGEATLMGQLEELGETTSEKELSIGGRIYLGGTGASY